MFQSCYYKCTYNRTQGTNMLTGGYNNTEAQFRVRTKSKTSLDQVRTNPRMIHSQPINNKSNAQRMELFKLPGLLRQAR